MAGVVAFAGSRNLRGAPLSLVTAQARQVAGLGYALAVGCCVGVDAAVLDAVPPAALQVFAAFGAGFNAPGSWKGSAISSVRAVARAGGQCSWWAGGGYQVPLSARLARRTQAVVAAADVALFAFVSSAGSRGTALACRAAVRQGLPVYVWAKSFAHLPLLESGYWALAPVGSLLLPALHSVGISNSGWQCWYWVG